VRRRHADRRDELARAQILALIAEIELLSSGRRRARGAAAQLEFGAERDQHRHRIADRRAVGEIAAQRARIAHRRRTEALRELGELRIGAATIAPRPSVSGTAAPITMPAASR
jgi:hypothetical protein